MIGARPRISARRVLAPEMCREVDSSKSPWHDRIQAIRFRSSLLLFRSNLLWWTALFALCLVLVAPLAVVDVPPLLDYPNHLARAYILAHGLADLHLSQMYVPHWAIIPNL